VLRAHVYEPPPSPLQFVPDLGNDLAAVLLQALAKPPVERYQSAGAFLAALQDVANTRTRQQTQPIVTEKLSHQIHKTIVQQGKELPVGEPYLQCITTGKVFPIQGRAALVGRSDELPINLASLPESKATSRVHANIWRAKSGEYRIKDEHSLNGTIVDGAMLEAGKRTRLQDGSEIQFGVDGPRLKFHLNVSK
jgi:hypothetical protein